MDSLRRQAALRLFALYFAGIFAAGLLLSFSTIKASKQRLIENKRRSLAANLELMLNPETLQAPDSDITGLKTLISKRRIARQKRQESRAQQAGLPVSGALNALKPKAKRPVVVLNNTTTQAGEESTEFGDNGSSKFVPQDQDIPVIPVKYTKDLDEAGRAQIRATIVDVAKKYLGTRYVWAGKSPKGFDCSGFTSYIMNLYGIVVSPSSRHQALQGKAKPLAEAQTGDLVFFSRYGKGGRISHVALVVDNTAEGITVIHATSRGIVIDNIHESKYWRPKILFAKDVISG